MYRTGRQLGRIGRLWPVALFVTALPAVAAVLFGCNEAEHYETLSFFFDGVPEPGSEKPPDDTPTQTPAERKRAVQTVWTHQPWARRQCDGCHNKFAPREFLAPKDKLCDRCHQEVREAEPLHGPVAAGACLECHAPHSSERPHLLVAEPRRLCLKCHDDTFNAEADYHAPWAQASCLTCHNGHTTTRRGPAGELKSHGSEDAVNREGNGREPDATQRAK